MGHKAIIGISQPFETDVVVIGAGIFGLAASEQCLHQGAAKVTLLERHQVGHRGGSSHGRVRIARSAYAHPAYVHLMKRTFDEYWPRLSHRVHRQLLRPNPALIFGPKDGLVDQYLNGVRQAGADVIPLSGQDRAHWSTYIRETEHRILLDRTAAIIDADATRQGLMAALRELKCDIREGVRVEHIETGQNRLVVHTNAGTILCDRIICTAGPWTSQLFPSLATTLRVVRQHVGFYAATAARDRPITQAVWIYLGDRDDTVHYGLPEDPYTAKAAAHVRLGHDDDFSVPADVDALALTALDTFMAAQFNRPLRRVDAQTCLYTPAPNDDFIIDFMPTDDRIIVAAGFSGHGFKFAPLIGAALAQLALDGQCQIDEFSSMRPRFTWPKQQGKT
ncbi:MAG: FAD-dependent oxidoreductase [Myxococcota bacterium]|nr:FAD-dependent oxidoreductase [Myxococcota bacterium]